MSTTASVWSPTMAIADAPSDNANPFRTWAIGAAVIVAIDFAIIAAALVIR